MIVVSTGDQALSVVDFFDPATDTSLDGMEYRNTAVQNCSIQAMEVIQSTSSLAIADVLGPRSY